jgi:hypothetical protein
VVPLLPNVDRTPDIPLTEMPTRVVHAAAIQVREGTATARAHAVLQPSLIDVARIVRAVRVSMRSK